jgi:hypothetical protein
MNCNVLSRWLWVVVATPAVAPVLAQTPQRPWTPTIPGPAAAALPQQGASTGHAIASARNKLMPVRGADWNRCRPRPPQTAFHSVAESDGCRAIKLEIKLDHVADMFPMSAALGSTP